MRALAHSLRDRGEPLPMPWHIPVKVYPGTLVELLAAAGVGKSMFALNWAIYLAERGLPALIHSADTSYDDQAVRAVSYMQGLPSDEVEKNLPVWRDWIWKSEIPLRFSELPLDAASFPDLIVAEREYLGQSPALVVVDVVSDLLTGEESIGEYRKIFASLKRTARKYRCAILALNHVKVGPAASGDSFVGMSDEPYRVGGQISQIGLSLWRNGMENLSLHVWKNRMGPSNKLASLRVDYPAATIRDLHGGLFT